MFCTVVGIGVTATGIGGVTIVVPNTGNVIGVPCTLAASLVAGLLGPVAIAVYALVLSVPAWIAWYWLLRRG